MRLRIAPWQSNAINNPYTHFGMLGGIATGKTFTGAQFAIKQVKEHPDKTGFIGANTYDQLSQATLRELFYWLNELQIPFVSDRKPPLAWGSSGTILKDYHNTITLRIYDKTVLIFTRVLAEGDALRGIEFSWYWIDETRETPRNTHDILLSRMRESSYMKGLVTTTTNAEDWVHNRFVKGNDGSFTYGSLHVKTEEAVDFGIITKEFYDSLRRSYSPLVAAQELDALHVNILGGRAYYAGGEHNRSFKAPWGDLVPNPDRPLIIGCDFNFSPAPCIWMIGQEDKHSERLHWFGEIFEANEPNTRMLTKRVITNYPGFHYRVFGDTSGTKGTTSNAGETDYNQMGEEFADAGCSYNIDVEQSNPRVKDRVENMNAHMKNGLGEVNMTWDPNGCPNLDGDIRLVGWKYSPFTGNGKLDNAGDHNRTHAGDGAGYALMKLHPPGRQATNIISEPSAVRAHLRDLI